MNSQSSNNHMDCGEQIVTACLVMNVSFPVIKSLFQEKEITVFDYSNGSEKELMVEIRFENATLCCLFDEKQVCDSAFLFLDYPADVLHYIKYCNEGYLYDYILSAWIIKDCCIQLQFQDKECRFLFLPKNTVF